MPAMAKNEIVGRCCHDTICCGLIRIGAEAKRLVFIRIWIDAVIMLYRPLRNGHCSAVREFVAIRQYYTVCLKNL